MENEKTTRNQTILQKYRQSDKHQDSGPFLIWTREEFQQIRKLMTMHKTLHTRDDIYRLYVSSKEGGRGLANINLASIDQYNDSETT